MKSGKITGEREWGEIVGEAEGEVEENRMEQRQERAKNKQKIRCTQRNKL